MLACRLPSLIAHRHRRPQGGEGGKRGKLPPNNFWPFFQIAQIRRVFFRAVPPRFKIFCSCSKFFAKVFIIFRTITCLVKIADIWTMKQGELCLVFHGEGFKNYTKRVSTKLPRIYHAKQPERYCINYIRFEAVPQIQTS